MSSMWSMLARACLRLYPAAWRARYGDEVLALANDAGVRPGDLLDLALTGLRLRARRLTEGGPMTPRTDRRAAALAAPAALLLAAPTAIFMGLNLVGRQVDWQPWLTAVLPGLPFLALLVALAPALRIGLRRGNADGVATLTVRLLTTPAWLVAVVVACCGLALAVTAYGVSENLLEALP